jgi:tetratricopeptide (TPR) repeat protein
MPDENEYDIFFSHSSLDHPPVKQIVEFLKSKGLKVWYDDKEISDYDEITKSIEVGLANSKILLAYYSPNYLQSRPCQYELTSALIAAHQLGNQPNRILVINPETTYDHIHPIELRDQSQPNRYLVSKELGPLADIITKRVHRIDKVFGEIISRQKIRWYGKTGIGSRRFVGRVTTMWKIHSALHASSFYFISKSHTPAVAQIIGMGGIGKSLIAEEYALWFAAAFPGGIFWLNAFGNDDVKSAMKPEEREAERIRQFVNITIQYGIVPENKKPDELIAEFHKKIAQLDLPFLWVVDDVPSGMTRDELEKWLAPTGTQGRTLITTRTPSYNFLGTSIDLNPLDPDDALELLSMWIKPHDGEERTAAKRIATILGYHPLALDVTGSQLERSISATPFIDFERELEDQTRDALELGKELIGLLPTGHEVSIARTFLISINQLDEEGKDFLRLASVLATAPIHGTLVFKVFAEVDSLTEDTGRQRAEKAISLATKQSLTNREGNVPATWVVHPLISRTMRFTDSKQDRSKQLREAAVKVHINTLFRVRDGRIHRELNSVLPHARELVTTAEDIQTCNLMDLVAKFDDLQGSYRSAEALYRHEVKIRQRLEGEKHPNTLAAMKNLAGMLSDQGDLTGARDLLEVVLKSCNEIFDEKNLQIFGTMNDLALTFLAQGNLAEARKLQEQVLNVTIQLLWSEHPNALIAMSNLAGTLKEQGDLVGARKLQEQVLDVRKRILGETHPDTLVALDNLAGTLKEQGDLVGARKLQEQVLEGSKEIFGDEHPETLTTMNNLAETLRIQGDFAGARELQEQVLISIKKILGENHPKTLIAMNNLALTLHSQRDLRGARVLLEQVVEISKKNLGEEHPDTITSINNLGDLLREQGNLTEARKHQEQVLKTITNLLGEEHPKTLICMNNLALTLHEQGDLVGARKLLEQVLEVSKKTLGEEHPDTITSMNNFAELLSDQGDLVGARERLEQVLDVSKKILGERHPITIAIMNNLVKTLRKQGHVVNAWKLQKRVQKLRKKI